jgi:predicted transposase YdaD
LLVPQSENPTRLPPALALLQLIVLPDSAVPAAAKAILDTATSKGNQAFRQTLDLVEAILISKFPQLTSREILAMLDIKTADIRQTRFYQEVFQEGWEEGREEGAQQAEAGLLVRMLARNLGTLSEEQETQIQALSLEQLDALGDALFDFANREALDAWLQNHPVEPVQTKD